MTTYRYWSRSIQKVSGAEADVAGDALMEALKPSPVLQRVEIAFIPGEPFVAFDIQAEVSANHTDKLSILCAFASADEAWRCGLAEVGLEPNCVRSQFVA